MKNKKLIDAQISLRSLANKESANKSAYFFKTKKGEYGYGDKFLGVTSPAVRTIAKKFFEIPLSEVKTLIKSSYHEERALGLIILTIKFDKTKSTLEQTKIYKFYISHFKYINNWDLVDVSCPYIVGKYLMDKDRLILSKWASSDHLWTKRIAIVSNWWPIRKGDLESVFRIAKILLNDEHDLIHKAVGWMLREAGKKNISELEKFLKSYYKNMPRTMLRYAIEKMPEAKRQRYLKGKI